VLLEVIYRRALAGYSTVRKAGLISSVLYQMSIRAAGRRQ